jgi:hypothetical protein
MTKHSRLTILFIGIALVAAFVLLASMIVDMTGVLPGDQGTEPTASLAETSQDSTSAPVTMDLAAGTWVTVVLVMTVILGLGIAYGQYRASKVTSREKERTEAAVREWHARENDPEFKD